MKNYKKKYLEKIYQNLNELNEKEFFKFIKLIHIVKKKIVK